MTKNCIISVALMLLAICPSASALRASDDIVKKDVVITTQNKNIYDRDGSHGVEVFLMSIKACFTRYGLMSETEDPTDVTFEDRTITTATTITADKITVRNVSVINGGGLKLVGNVEIYPSFLVEGGSSLEIKSH